MWKLSVDATQKKPVMTWDLSHTPVTGIQAVVDGDAHITNFGLFGSLQRDAIIDMNDFDEATIGRGRGASTGKAR